MKTTHFPVEADLGIFVEGKLTNSVRDALFVLSGRNSREEIASLDIKPENTYDDLAAVLKDLE